MAKQITWSPLAKGALRDLLTTQPREQAQKMYGLIQNAVHRVMLNPFIGQPTEEESVRYIVPHSHYTLFYRHSLQQIELLVLWNNHYKIGSVKK